LGNKALSPQSFFRGGTHRALIFSRAQADHGMREGRQSRAYITFRVAELAIPMGLLADFLCPDGWPPRYPVAEISIIAPL
jgi:hypothetical protein